MEIGNVSQGAGQAVVGPQPNNTQQVGEKKTVTDQNLIMQKDFQVILNEGIKAKLADFTTLLQHREELIKSLPEDIQKAVTELLEQMSSDIELPQGLSSLLTGQKNIAEQLKNMSNVLEFAATLNKEENKDIKTFLQNVIENSKDQLSTTAGQSAKELLQLAKQLLSITTVPQSDFKQAVEEYLQAKLPENMQQLSGNDQKIINQLTKLLEKNMSPELQQFAKENNLPKLPGVWAALEVVDAWSFKDIQPKTLQAAADLLNQIAQEIPAGETTLTGQLEQFVKSLPSDVSSKATVVSQLEQFVKSLPADVSSKDAVVSQLEKFVKNLSPEVGSKVAVISQLEQFVRQLPTDVSSKATVVSQLEQFVKSLPSEVSNKATVISQLEQFVKNLPSDVSSKAIVVSQLEQFVKNLPADAGSKATVVSQLEQFVKNLPSDASSKAIVVSQLEQFVKNLPSDVSSKATVVSQLEQFVKSLPAEASSKAIVVSQLEQFVKSLSADVSSKATVVSQLEQFVKNLPTDVSSKATVVSQLEQFVKSLPADVGSKATVVSQLEQFVRRLPSDVSSKATVVSQLEQFVKQLPVDAGSKATVISQLEQFVKSLPAEAGSKATVVSQLEQFVKQLPADVGSKATVVSQLEQFVKNLSPEVGSKVAVISQLEQFARQLPTDVSSRATVVSQLEKFVKNLPSDVSSKAVVVSQLEQFVKSLPSDVNSKAAVASQLEEFVRQLPTEVSGKATVVSQLEQFVKSLPSEVSSKAIINAQVEQFLKTLPPEIGKALQQVLKQSNLPTNLRGLAETFTNAAVLNEHMTNEQKSFSMNFVKEFTGNSSSIPQETNQVLTQLATKFSDTATILDQLKLIVKQLKTELLSGDPSTLEKEQNSLEQLTKLFGPNIPQALQEGATKHRVVDLPKVWVLLKGLEAEQWQNTEPQNLQKSAALVKELAQSIYKSPGATGEKQAEHSILSFSVPLQVATGVYYPAHIHIYQQQQDEAGNQPTEREFETWLRVCVDTEHIGMVDSVFRLYNDNKLDVRVTFPNTVAADEFSHDLHNIRKSLDESNLNLTEIMVNNI